MTTPVETVRFFISHDDVVHTYVRNGTKVGSYQFNVHELREVDHKRPIEEVIAEVALYFFHRDIQVWFKDKIYSKERG